MNRVEKIRQEIIASNNHGLFIASNLKLNDFELLTRYFKEIPVFFVTKSVDSNLIIECKGKDSEKWLNKLAYNAETFINSNYQVDGIVDYQHFFEHIKDEFLEIGIVILDFEILNIETDAIKIESRLVDDEQCVKVQSEIKPVDAIHPSTKSLLTDFTLPELEPTSDWEALSRNVNKNMVVAIDYAVKRLNINFITRESYNPATGIMRFCGQEIHFTKKNTKKETQQSKALRELFKTVKSFSEGTDLYKIFSVKVDISDPKIYKKARSTLDEINRIVYRATTIRKLIDWDRKKYFINKIHRMND